MNDSICLQLNRIRTNVPNIRCSSPQRIYNKYLDEYLVVPCRKCVSCRNSYSRRIKDILVANVQKYPYTVAITLTYDNEHMPIMYDLGHGKFAFNRTGEIFDFSSVSSLFYKRPTVKLEDGTIVPSNINGFGVPYKKDIQDFLKRLRISLHRHFIKYNIQANEKLSYFVCTEYTPTSLRPHYHGTIFCESREAADFCIKNVAYCWKNASIEFRVSEFLKSSNPSYIAKYVSGYDDLPPLLSQQPCRTWHLASKTLYKALDQESDETLRKVFFDQNIERLEYDDFKESLAFVPISYKVISRHFPKPRLFSRKDDKFFLRLYEKYKCNRYAKKIFRDGEVIDNSHSDKCIELQCADDSYNYSDYNFSRMMDFNCKKYDVTPLFYIRQLRRIYSKYSLLQLRNQFLLQQTLPRDSLPLLYDGNFFSLPRILDVHDFYRSELDYIFRYLGFRYEDFYSNNCLNFDFISKWKGFYSEFFYNQLDFHTKSSKLKLFNDLSNLI